MITFRYFGENKKEYKSLDKVQNLSQRNAFKSSAALIQKRLSEVKVPKDCEGNSVININVGIGLEGDSTIGYACCAAYKKLLEQELIKINQNKKG
jgi:hypothetical protein